MTIALRAAGSATASSVGANPSVPALASAGDISILTVACKPFDVVITTPSGWTKLGEWTNGTDGSANDVGSTIVAAFYKVDAAPGAIGAIDSTGSLSVMCASINTFSTTLGGWDVSSFTSGVDTTHAANFSATGVAGIDVAAGDRVCIGCGTNSDAGSTSSRSISGMAGATLGGISVHGDNPIGTGQDMRIVTASVPVSSGSSNAAPTFSFNNASSSSGTVYFLRLREVAGGVTATASGIASEEAFGSPSVSLALSAAPGGIASGEAFGTPTAALGAVGVVATATGIPSQEAFGTAAVDAALTASPTGIVGLDAFGTPSATLAVTASPVGISSAEAFGVPVGTVEGGDIVARPGNIPTGEAFGSPGAGLALEAVAAAIPSGEAFGQVTAALALSAVPGSIASGEAFGVPSASFVIVAAAEGIASGEAFGVPIAKHEAFDADLSLGEAYLNPFTASVGASSFEVGGAFLTDWEAGE